MNKNLKALPLLVIFFSSLNVFDAVAADFPILNAACRWAKKENNGATLAGVLVTSFLAHQYYKHKARPKDEDISPEGFTRRWNEIVHGEIALYKKIKLLVSFIDDFYVFGRRSKAVDIETKTVALDGTEITMKDKKTTIKGTGPVTFLYDNIFDKLEDILKFMGVVGSAVILVDGVLGGQFALLLTPSGNKFTPPADNGNGDDKIVLPVNEKNIKVNSTADIKVNDREVADIIFK